MLARKFNLGAAEPGLRIKFCGKNTHMMRKASTALDCTGGGEHGPQKRLAQGEEEARGQADKTTGFR